MGLELAKAFVRVRADLTKLRPDLNQARAITTSSLRGIGGISSGILGTVGSALLLPIKALQFAAKSVFDAVVGIKNGILQALQDTQLGIIAITGAFAAFGKGFITQGLFNAGQFEQTTIAFETMIGDAKETQKTLERLTKFAAQTPFDMPEVLAAARGLLQFGERGDQLMETIKILGEAAAGTSTDFGMVALIFNQIRGVGKLLTQDFRQLATRGILSLNDLAKHFNVTTAAAQRMMSAGKITFADVRQILKEQTQAGGRFFNLMLKQSNSFLGLLGALKDSWNILARELASTVMPVAKAIVGRLVTIVNWMREFVVKAKGAAGAALIAATAVSTLAASFFAATIASRLLGISLFKTFIGTGIGAVIIGLGALIGWLVQKHWDWIKVNIIQSETMKKVQDAAITAWSYIKVFAIRAMTEIRAIIFQNRDQFAEIWLNMREIAGNVWAGLVSLWEMLGVFASSVLKYIQERWLAMTGQVGSSWEDFGKFVIESFKIFIDWLSLLSTNWELTWDYMKNYAQEIWLILFDTARVTANRVLAVFSGIGEVIYIQWRIAFAKGLGFIALWANTVSGIFAELGLYILNVLSKPWESFTGTATDRLLEQIDRIQNRFERDKQKYTVGPYRNMEEMKKIFNDAYEKNKGPDTYIGKEVEELRKQREEIRRKMEEERNKKRQGAPAAPKAPGAPDAPEAPKAPSAQDIGGAVGASLESGRFNIAELGNKVQEAFLKNQENKLDQKRNGLLQQSVNIQQQLLNKPNNSGTAILASP